MLIVLSQSPSKGNYDSILQMAIRCAKNTEVGVVHIQDASLAVTLNEYCERLTNCGISIYALRSDCQARGISEKIVKDVKIIDYKQLVKLVMTKYNKLVSWI